jgi:archaellum component FlaC
MNSYGLKKHDERHAEVERQTRHLLEQVAELTIDLSEARADVRRLQGDVDTKIPIPVMAFGRRAGSG